ncbi:hypothetical protein ACFVZW_21595 [Streptomyces sp. NPDC059567]|uniref:hypothetical protein n=1 Tax=Streptomyces sp. NPDC059567 TaxID=3346867 RepID=UPI0036C68ADC
MTSETSRYTDFESLREQAVALRREGLSLRQIRDRLQVYNNDILHRLVKGEPPPEWTKRPNAKDDLRARARELRLQGRTYDQIQLELGCSKSSISLWVRDLPKPERKRTREQASEIAKRGWEPMAWLDVLGIERDRLTFRVMIHENADVPGAERYWAELIDVHITTLSRTTLKKHNPKTVRKNVGDDYRGCLVIKVLQGSDLYQRIEGWWSGMVVEARRLTA